jgi:hypothetical protein
MRRFRRGETRDRITAVGVDAGSCFGTYFPKSLPQCTTESCIIFFDRFQFALPPDWNAIILRAKVGIGPVGARP